MSRIIIFILILTFVSSCTSDKQINTQSLNIDDEELPKKQLEGTPPLSAAYDLLDTYKFIDSTPTEQDLGIIRKNLDSRDCATRKLSAVVIYNSDKSEANLLFTEFSVKDYLERQAGNYNYITTDEMTALLEEIEQEYSNYPVDLHALMTFCEVESKNYWVKTNDGKMSIARFFRSAFLSSALESEEEAMEMQALIDKRTAQEQLEN